MLVVWYIWTRFFWFIRTETAPWPFFRYKLYRFSFTHIFKYDQLNLFQQKIFGSFYIYLYFLPMSANFAHNYSFTLNRHYFSGFGYKMISYEGLHGCEKPAIDNLADYSEEFSFLKNLTPRTDSLFSLVTTLKYITYKYYYSYYIYYLKSFRELEPFDFKNVTPDSLFLSTYIAFSIISKYKPISFYNFYNFGDFYRFINADSSLTFVSTIPQLPVDTSKFDLFLEGYYKKLAKVKNQYLKNYEKLNVKSFFFGSINLSKLLTAKFNGANYVMINKKWVHKLKNYLYIRFSDSSVSKYISLNSTSSYKIFYIRKNRIFNKGRYSRNRQLYRTGVFWCLWLNVIVVYGLYFFFYRFMFNFGYLWIGMAFLAFSFIFARVCQARLYNVQNLLNEFRLFWNWVSVLFYNIYNVLYKNYLNMFSIYILTFYSNIVLLKVMPFFYTNYIYKFLLAFSEETRKIKSARFVFYWEYFVGEDKSFLKLKSKIHWFKQVWKMLFN